MVNILLMISTNSNIFLLATTLQITVLFHIKKLLIKLSLKVSLLVLLRCLCPLSKSEILHSFVIFVSMEHISRCKGALAETKNDLVDTLLRVIDLEFIFLDAINLFYFFNKWRNSNDYRIHSAFDFVLISPRMTTFLKPMTFLCTKDDCLGVSWWYLTV